MLNVGIRVKGPNGRIEFRTVEELMLLGSDCEGVDDSDDDDYVNHIQPRISDDANNGPEPEEPSQEDQDALLTKLLEEFDSVASQLMDDDADTVDTTLQYNILDPDLSPMVTDHSVDRAPLENDVSVPNISAEDISAPDNANRASFENDVFMEDVSVPDNADNVSEKSSNSHFENLSSHSDTNSESETEVIVPRRGRGAATRGGRCRGRENRGCGIATRGRGVGQSRGTQRGRGGGQSRGTQRGRGGGRGQNSRLGSTGQASDGLKNLSWKEECLERDAAHIAFLGDDTLPSHVRELATPYEFFRYFFSEELMEHIAFESTIYCKEKEADVEKHRQFTATDIRRYCGILILSSVIHLRDIRSHWNADLGCKVIQDTMTCNQFENIRRYLHFNRNELAEGPGQPGFDKLHKIRPIINTLRPRFLSIPLTESLSVDEQMCATKMKHSLRQYMPAKPHKWGFKLFVLAGTNGYGYDFEIYAGAGAEIENKEPDLGASANIVVRLARSIPPNLNHKLFFDNYYTSIPLLIYLDKRNIQCLGTVRRNRIINNPLTEESLLSKKDRGYTEEFVTSWENSKMNCIQWKDNKTVCLLSTFVGSSQMSTIRRFNKQTRTYEDIPCPAIIHKYNEHMGGVDAQDSLLGRYHIRMKANQKWYMRLFYHLLDLAVINAWLVYRRVVENPLSISAFRVELGKTLCLLGKNVTPTRGRPRKDAVKEWVRKKHARFTVSSDVRYDESAHWPGKGTKRYCQNKPCKSQTQFVCQKCDVPLCISSRSNCFYTYHNK